MSNRKNEIIIGVDPGTSLTAYSIVEVKHGTLNQVLQKDKTNNQEIYNAILQSLNEYLTLEKIQTCDINIAIEHMESHGMAVGMTTFETCYFIGELKYKLSHELYNDIINNMNNNIDININLYRIYRSQEKSYICNSVRAKDSNIRQALIDKFGEVGTKNNQGYFYGFKADIWSSFAVAYTYYLMALNNVKTV